MLRKQFDYTRKPNMKTSKRFHCFTHSLSSQMEPTLEKLVLELRKADASVSSQQVRSEDCIGR